MAQFKAFDKKVEVLGKSIIAVIEGVGYSREKILKILNDNAIENLKVDQWYPQQNWLNAFRKIAWDIGPYALYCMGASLSDYVKFPEVSRDSLENALSSIDIAYQMNHRNGEIGNYTFYIDKDGVMRVTSHNPYPCEFDRGIIEGRAKKFIRDDQYLAVKHFDGYCRDNGDEECHYFVEINSR